MVDNEAIAPRHLCKIRPGYEAVKPGTGKSRNKAARVGLVPSESSNIALVPRVSEITLMVRLKLVLCSDPRTLEPD